MSNESRSISGKVDVDTGSAERVALELMKIVSTSDGEPDRRDRTYWLTLYRQCFSATRGHPMETILSFSK